MRKIGSGLNTTRVVRRDIESEWLWARRMARLPLNKKWHWEKPWGASAIEARQSIIRDINGTLGNPTRW